MEPTRGASVASDHALATDVLTKTAASTLRADEGGPLFLGFDIEGTVSTISGGMICDSSRSVGIRVPRELSWLECLPR